MSPAPAPEGAAEFWVYLATSPLFWLALTLSVYLGADRLSAWSGRNSFVNPVLIAIVALGAVLLATGTSYETYFEGAQFVHVLLGPATVALAIPIVRHRAEIRANLLPLVVALTVGAVVGIASAVGLAVAVGLDGALVASLAPKSVTAPIAMGVAREIGGVPELTAVLVIATGITGAALVTPTMNLLRVTDWRARGFAVGLAAHGIGTARALQVNPVAGTFAGLAMALNGLVTAFAAPVVVAWIVG
ncbi:LrgB family protein [Salinarimonas chemoclinalis]|uniref:LrgB family protein n=1 Tax=Salinarimonas chemoclinalis TaxID=3241599 RepID=UPI003555D680